MFQCCRYENSKKFMCTTRRFCYTVLILLSSDTTLSIGRLHLSLRTFTRKNLSFESKSTPTQSWVSSGLGPRVSDFWSRHHRPCHVQVRGRPENGDTHQKLRSIEVKIKGSRVRRMFLTCSLLTTFELRRPPENFLSGC